MKYEIVDSEFNRKNYPDMIGKVMDSPPLMLMLSWLTNNVLQWNKFLDFKVDCSKKKSAVIC